MPHEQNDDAFRRMKPTVERKYRGKYIAMANGRLVAVADTLQEFHPRKRNHDFIVIYCSKRNARPGAMESSATREPDFTLQPCSDQVLRDAESGCNEEAYRERTSREVGYVKTMANRRFHVFVERDKESGLFAARCLEMSVFSQGKTKEEALRNIRNAINLHLDTLEDELKGKQVVEVEV